MPNIRTSVLSDESFISVLEEVHPIQPEKTTQSMALYRTEDDKVIKLLIQSSNSLADNLLIEVEKI